MPQVKQTILLNSHAMLLHSCDSLFSTKEMMNKEVISYFPFLESVFEDLLVQLEVESNITFKGIETKHDFLPGYYDYVFSFVDFDKKKAIQWQIVDKTEVYEAMKASQQSSHEKNTLPIKNPSKES